MNVNRPSRPQNSESRKTPSPDSVTKVIHIKGKAREKLIKATAVYTNIRSSVLKEVKDYSSLKGRITTTLQGNKKRFKELKKNLRENHKNLKGMKNEIGKNHTAIKSMKKELEVKLTTLEGLKEGEEKRQLLSETKLLMKKTKKLQAKTKSIEKKKQLLLRRTKILINSVKAVKVHIASQEKLLTITNKAHNIKYIKYTAQLAKIESVIKRFGKHVRATSNPTKSTTKKIKKSRSLNTSPKVKHLKGNTTQRVKKAQKIYSLSKKALIKNTEGYDTLLNRVAIPLQADKQELKKMKESLKSHHTALKAMKQGSEKTYLLDKIQFLAEQYKTLKKAITTKENLLSTRSKEYKAKHNRLSLQITKAANVIRSFTAPKVSRTTKRKTTKTRPSSPARALIHIQKKTTRVLKKARQVFSTMKKAFGKNSLRNKSLKNRITIPLQTSRKALQSLNKANKRKHKRLSAEIKKTERILKRLQRS
ncbi:MAG: hypothetical protein SP4CHLAM5_09800 [Chlamydiia bacterium]|nr:hypothetical protein [Chlamydiia bacterium]MCH9618838.1 hypothetical protein [Chlamydiia bacterium]MCH9624360.1 hypothetical protein [Chlamydiia bacterium]